MDYAAHGILEYWIIDPDKETIAQYYLIDASDKEYFPAKMHANYDTITSRIIPGFEIPVRAIFDEEANLEAMNQLVKK